MDPSDGRPGPLLEQEDLYRVLFEQAADPMYLIDPASGRFLDANDIAFRVTGWSREELLGMTFRELHDPGDAALLDSIEPRLREQGRIRLAGVSQRRRDGTLLPVELSLSRLEAGDRVYGFVIAHDITQRLREAEQLQSQAAALAEAKGFLEAVQERASDGLYLVDDSGRIISVNARAVEMMRRPREEVQGRHFNDFSPPELREERAERFRRTLAGEEIRYRTRLHPPDGAPRDVDVVMNRLEWGGRHYVFAVMRDVSDALKQAVELKETKEFLELLQRSASDAFLLTDDRGVVQWANRKAEEMTGIPIGEAAGRHFTEFADPAIRSGDLEAFRRMLAGEDVRIRSTVIGRNGLRSDVEVTGTSVERGGRRYVFAILRDAGDQLAYERRLEESKRLLEMIQETAGDGMVLTDEDGIITFANRRICEIMARRREDFLGRHFLKVSNPVEHARYVEYNREILSGRTATIRGRELRDDGREVILDLTSSRVEQGGRKYVFSIVRDVTDEVRTAEELALRKTLLECQGEAAIDGILFVAPEGKILSYNRRFVELWGIPDEVVAARSDDAAIASVLSKVADPKAFTERIRLLYDRREESSLDEIALVDGRLFERYSAPVRSAEGTYYGRVWYFRDVTAQRRTEREIRDSRERIAGQQASLVEMTRVGEGPGAGLAGAIRRATEACARTLDVERVSVWRFSGSRGSIHCADLYQRTPSRHGEGQALKSVDFPDYFRAIAEMEVVAADDAATDPRTREFAAGYLRPLGISSMMDAPIRVGGRLEGVLCHEHVGPARRWTTDEQLFAVAMANLVSLAIEQADRERAEAETRQAYEQLKRAQEQLVRSEKLASIGTLVSGVAHEINNPINVIYGNLKLLKERGGKGRPVRGMLNDALKAAEEARLAIEVFRSFARDPRAAEPADLNGCIEESLLASARWLRGIRVVRRLGKLPSVRCFPGQIKQVLFNLVRNAVEAMEGKGTVTIRSFRRGRTAVVEVGDTGPGVPRALRARIFDPFFTTKAVGSGMGLGLTISASILDHHGGRLKLASASRRGSVFRVELPLR